jgi:hypothetical protein
MGRSSYRRRRRLGLTPALALSTMSSRATSSIPRDHGLFIRYSRAKPPVFNCRLRLAAAAAVLLPTFASA